MSKIVIKKEYCKACGNCVRACRQKALKLTDEINAKGYHVVSVDEALCIGCGVCYTVCPDYVFTVLGKGGTDA